MSINIYYICWQQIKTENIREEQQCVSDQVSGFTMLKLEEPEKHGYCGASGDLDYNL